MSIINSMSVQLSMKKYYNQSSFVSYMYTKGRSELTLFSKRKKVKCWEFLIDPSKYIWVHPNFTLLYAFFTSEQPKRYKLWSCQKMCDVLHYLLDNIFIRFGSKLYRQIVGIPMGTNCAPLVADLFLFCYERDFMTIIKLILLKLLTQPPDI